MNVQVAAIDDGVAAGVSRGAEGLRLRLRGRTLLGRDPARSSPEETAVRAASENLICTVAPGGAISLHTMTFRLGVAACAICTNKNKDKMPHSLCQKDSLELLTGCE
jgi:hypothetical protein